MSYQIKYHYLVKEEDIPNLPKTWQEIIRDSVEKKLTSSPDLYGKRLRRSLKGYWKMRVGDYRVIYKIESQVVKIILIKHRSVVYEQVLSRIRWR